jgi:choline-sulfatase
MRETKPNILFIMADEHNPKVAGFYPNPLAHTPALDSLSERGIVFDQAYCNSPLCAPSRHSFTACQYVHRVSAWNNECWIADDNIASLPRVMTAAGYDAALCGKQHYDQTRRYGFAEIGGNMNASFHTGLGTRRAADDETIDRQEAAARFSMFRVGEDSAILRHDEAVTNGVLDFLSTRGIGDRPFFLFAGFVAPHFPLIVPKDIHARYAGRIPLPEIPPGHLEQLPLNYQHLRRGFGTIDVPDSVTTLGRELYYGLTEWVDREIGKVLDGLKAMSFADNTVVIYASDHGENMGEHGMWWKNSMFDSSTRVPLIVSWPERWPGGQRRSGVCSLVDVVQTVAGLGGADAPEDWDGDSMLPLLDDPKHGWKDFAVSQYYGHNIASGYAMIRSGQWKYVYHTPPRDDMQPERELYDIAADTGEFRNLAADPSQRDRIADLESRLVLELGEHPDETEQRSRAELAIGYRRLSQPLGQ